MIRKNKGSAIVSVFNEEKTVKEVVVSLLNCQLIDEVIVVNDGSTDNTAKILKQIQQLQSYQFHYLEFKENKGKAYAMVSGVEISSGEILVFVDADITGLNYKHIEKLIAPLIFDQADMVIGRRYSEQNPKVDISKPIDDWLGGERALYRKDILPILWRMKDTRYGVETLLNLYYKSHNKRIKIVDLEGLIHFAKYKKYRLHVSLRNYMKETLQILKTIALNYFMVFTIIKNIIIKE
jgi:glycosyltransferase involved in cell wall biosynthesis